jgi:Rieske Fe-S protein
MNIGLEKTAVYKDTDRKIYEFSALCPHLKCVVEWNNVEKTWDCPCHGSRFDAKGNVVNGPALGNLKPVSQEKVKSQ